jgi:hypothetical protein
MVETDSVLIKWDHIVRPDSGVTSGDQIEEPDFGSTVESGSNSGIISRN